MPGRPHINCLSAPHSSFSFEEGPTHQRKAGTAEHGGPRSPTGQLVIMTAVPLLVWLNVLMGAAPSMVITGGVVSGTMAASVAPAQMDPVTDKGEHRPYWLQKQVAVHMVSVLVQGDTTRTLLAATPMLPLESAAV